MKTYTITFFLTLFSLVAQAQEFELDSTFGEGGIVITKTDFTTSINDVAQGSDGRIFAVGYSFNSYNQLCAYLPNGQLDTSFGNNGIINSTLLNEASTLDMVIQPDGKIIVGGLYDIIPESPIELHSYLIRYLPNGNLDTNFADKGVVRIQTNRSRDGIKAILLQPDGKIVAGGFARPDFLLMRLNTNGDLDTSFGNNGILTTRIDSSAVINDLEIQKDGKIIAVGSTSIESKSKFALARYKVDGQLDKDFGNDGIVTTEFETNPFAEDVIKSVQLLKDGSILAVGSSRGLAMSRYMSDGTIDTSFANQGKYNAKNALPQATDAIMLANNKIIVSGSAFDSGFDISLSMFQENGRLDSSFGNAGQLIQDLMGGMDYANCMTLLSDKELIVAGSSRAEIDSASSASAHFTLVKYVFDASTGLQEKKEESERSWLVFPNPSQAYFSLVSKQNLVNATHIELLNSSGKVVVEQATEGSETTIDVRQLPVGLYLYRIHSKQRMLQSGKVLKQ